MQGLFIVIFRLEFGPGAQNETDLRLQPLNFKTRSFSLKNEPINEPSEIVHQRRGVMKSARPESRTLLQLGLLLLMAVGLTACGGGKQIAGGDPDKITQKQIREAGSAVSNAYILVERLHPDWLQKRGTSSLTQQSDVSVYIEGDRRGGPEVLRQISVMDVKSIEHLDADEATLRYGSGHDHGVIRVELKMSNSG